MKEFFQRTLNPSRSKMRPKHSGSETGEQVQTMARKQLFASNVNFRKKRKDLKEQILRPPDSISRNRPLLHYAGSDKGFHASGSLKKKQMINKGEERTVTASTTKGINRGRAGIVLKRIHGIYVVCDVSEKCMFAGTDLSVGDKVLRINGIECRGKTANEVVNLIAEAHGPITITSRRETNVSAISPNSDFKQTLRDGTTGNTVHTVMLGGASFSDGSSRREDFSPTELLHRGEKEPPKTAKLVEPAIIATNAKADSVISKDQGITHNMKTKLVKELKRQEHTTSGTHLTEHSSKNVENDEKEIVEENSVAALPAPVHHTDVIEDHETLEVNKEKKKTAGLFRFTSFRRKKSQTLPSTATISFSHADSSESSTTSADSSDTCSRSSGLSSFADHIIDAWRKW